MNKDNKNIEENQINLTEFEIFNNSNLTSEEINNFAKTIMWSSIPDSKLYDQQNLITKLDCVKYIDKMRMLRIVTRDIENIHLYPIGEYEFTGEEIIKSVMVCPELLDIIKIKEGTLTMAIIIEIAKTHPHIIKRINLDSVNISTEEAVEIAKVGNVDIITKIKNNLTEINIIDKFKIIKANNYHIDILNKVNIFDKEFDNSYYIREIIVNGDYYDNLNIECLKQNDWIYILTYKPELKKYLNINTFLEGDIFFLIELCLLFPEFLNYINENNAHEITSLGWEKLLIEFIYDDRLVDLCDFSKLEERTWKKFEENREDLLIYKT